MKTKKKRCSACHASPCFPGFDVCKSCIYAIQAYLADCNWMEAPSWLREYVFFDTGHKEEASPTLHEM